MKKSRFSEGQIAFILKQAEDGTAVGEVCRKAGISEATVYNWRKKYAGLMPSEMRRLRQLEQENGRQKRIAADLSLDKEMLQDVIRAGVDHVRQTRKVSIRRACAALQAERARASTTRRAAPIGRINAADQRDRGFGFGSAVRPASCDR